MKFPVLSNEIAIAVDGDVSDLWDRFEIFEALHHSMTIDNPMSSSDLDRVVELLAPSPGERVLDLACGHGELLRRQAATADIDGTGVDVSPWMLRTAHSLAQDAAPALQWVLSDAKHYGADGGYDIVSCLGASWVWHGLPGTIREIADRVRSGGRVAIGDMHLREGLNAADAQSSHGAVDSIEDIERLFDGAGIGSIERVATADSSWDAYLQRTRQAAVSWAELHPGDRAQQYLAEQREWEKHHAQDREILTWSVWVGEKQQ